MIRVNRSPLVAALAMAALTLVAVGCASKGPPAMTPPPLEISVHHFGGDPVSGPTKAQIENVTPQSAMLVSVRLLAVQQPGVNGSLAPLDAQTRLITASRGDVPTLTSGRLTRDCRWAMGDAAASTEAIVSIGPAHSASIGEYAIAIVPGATAVLDLAGGATARRIQLFMHDESDATAQKNEIELAIGIEDLVQASAQSTSGEGEAPTTSPTRPPQRMRELAVLNKISIEQPTPVLLQIPYPWQQHREQVIVALMNIAPPATDSPALAAAVEKLATDLSTAQANARSEKGPAIPAHAFETSQYQTALAGLADPASQRQCLAYLCGQVGAKVGEDVALVGSDDAIRDLCSRIEHGEESVQPDKDSLAWLLDGTTLKMLGEMQSGNKLPPELTNVLLRHTGQAGANAGSVDEILKASKRPSDFDARVTAENLVYLEDNSPAARVRAFDWLAARGKAPAGYDPLGPPRQRRDALERLYEAPTTNTATASQAADGRSSSTNSSPAAANARADGKAGQP